jgi:hypothetical protein
VVDYRHMGRQVRLGKKEPRVVPGALKLAKYLTRSLPPAPPARDWSSSARDFGMMLNDQLGDCTCATAGHFVQVVTAANGHQVTVPDASVERMYSRVGGYVPGDPSTDHGAYVVDALADWRDHGPEDADGKVHRILGSAEVDLGNREHFKQAIDCFGGVYLGLSLPLTAQDQERWLLSLAADGNERGSWGGHATSAHRYDQDGLWVVTWGAPLFLSWPFLDVYCDEAHVPVTEDWADADGAPNGLDKATLLADMTAVG